MTHPKILYSFIEGQHKFAVVPELPPYPNTCTGCSPGHACAKCNEKYDNWKYECDRIKSTAPEIVNIKIIAAASDGKGTIAIDVLGHEIECVPEIPFDLPNGLELREEQILNNGAEHDGQQCEYTMCYRSDHKIKSKCLGWCKKFFRIVKTESGLRNRLNEPIETWEQPDFLKPEPESQEDRKLELEAFCFYNHNYSGTQTSEFLKPYIINSYVAGKKAAYNEIQRKKP